MALHSFWQQTGKLQTQATKSPLTYIYSYTSKYNIYSLIQYNLQNQQIQGSQQNLINQN